MAYQLIQIAPTEPVVFGTFFKGVAEFFIQMDSSGTGWEIESNPNDGLDDAKKVFGTLVSHIQDQYGSGLSAKEHWYIGKFEQYALGDPARALESYFLSTTKEGEEAYASAGLILLESGDILRALSLLEYGFEKGNPAAGEMLMQYYSARNDGENMARIFSIKRARMYIDDTHPTGYLLPEILIPDIERDSLLLCHEYAKGLRFPRSQRNLYVEQILTRSAPLIESSDLLDRIQGLGYLQI